MSLVPFHRFLIATAIVFCVFFAGWEFVAYSHDGGTGALLIGIAFAAAAVLLSVYLVYLRRVLRLPGDETSDERPPGG